MTTAGVGATGRVGSLVTRQLLDAQESVRVLVRDPDKAHRLFDDAGGALDVRAVELADRSALAKALDGVSAVYTALGSDGLEGNLQRLVLDVAAQSSSLEQFVRLSVLNAGPSSRGINQRGHWNLDFAAEALGLPYATVRPSIFSASLLIAAPEIRSKRTWTGLADSGRVALSDHRDAADASVKILGDRTTWNAHYDLTGPQLFSWPEVMGLLSAELGEPVEFRTVSDQLLVNRLIDLGIAPAQAELLVTREWAVIAGENERTTDTVTELLGRPPRTVEAFLHENIDLFR